MTTAGWTALAITVFGAFCYAAASILQAVAARRSTSTVKTLGHPLYLIGIGCDAMAWIGSMIALRELAVYLVESVLAGSLAITVVAARFILRSRLRKQDIAAVAAVLISLTVLAMSAGPQQHVAASTELRLGFCAAAAAVILIGWGATKIGSAGLVAALGGLCLGGAALTGRALPSAPMDIATDPLTAALLAFAVTGMMMYAHALRIGQVGPVTAVHWTAEVIAPSAVALFLLGDTVRAGWHLPAAIAGLITVGAAILLATAPASSATLQPEALPAAQPRRALPATPLPAGVRHAERIIWWGAPPIWRPTNRTNPALIQPAVIQPAQLQPELIRPAQPALTWSPPDRALSASLSPQAPADSVKPVSATPARWPAGQSAWSYPVEREPSIYEPVRPAGTSTWSGPPPNRTNAA